MDEALTRKMIEAVRRLARSEALFAGTSSGADLVAAIEVGMRLGPEATVVPVLCDSGIKDLGTALYDRRQFAESA